jgi:hypothetical protein
MGTIKEMVIKSVANLEECEGVIQDLEAGSGVRLLVMSGSVLDRVALFVRSKALRPDMVFLICVLCVDGSNGIVLSPEVLRLVEEFPCVKLSFEFVNGVGFFDTLLSLSEEIKQRCEIQIKYDGLEENIYKTFSFLLENNIKNFEFSYYCADTDKKYNLNILGSELAKVGVRFICELAKGNDLNVKNFHVDYGKYVMFPPGFESVEQGLIQKIRLNLAKICLQFEMKGVRSGLEHFKKFIGLEM